MGKKKVAVSLRKPSQADSNAAEAFVHDTADSAVFAAKGSRVAKVELTQRLDGAALEAVVAVEETPIPVSEVHATEVTEVIATPQGMDSPQIPANDGVASAGAGESMGAPSTRLLTLRIPERLAVRLEAYCRKHDRDMSGLIADLVGAFLDGQADPAIASPLAAIRIVARWVRFQVARILRSAYVPAAA